MCECLPWPTTIEQERMRRWFGGEDLEGLPLHSKAPFKSYIEAEFVPTDRKSLEEYRAKNKRLFSERIKP